MQSIDKTLSGKTLYSHAAPLTQREAQLVNLLGNGLKNKEIGQALVSPRATSKVTSPVSWRR